MKRIADFEMGAKFQAVLDQAVEAGEEIVVVRKNRRVARIVPERAHQDARSAMRDLERTLDDASASAWMEQITRAQQAQRKTRRGTLKGLRNPWAT